MINIQKSLIFKSLIDTFLYFFLQKNVMHAVLCCLLSECFDNSFTLRITNTCIYTQLESGR